jgi:hypothetical protein
MLSAVAYFRSICSAGKVFATSISSLSGGIAPLL